jgi:hypothetical protein
MLESETHYLEYGDRYIVCNLPFPELLMALIESVYLDSQIVKVQVKNRTNI